jgi:hypothetical protein
MSEVEKLPLGWSDEKLPLHSVVSFYYSDEDTARQSLAFLQVGLTEPGTFCVLLADASRHAAILDQLQATHQGDLRELIDAGKLVTVSGLPSVEDLAQAMVPKIDQALAAGHKRIRLLGFMAWGQPGWPDASALKQCEAQLNKLAASYPIVIVCAYNVPQLPGDYVREKGLGNEPLIVINETVVT